MLISKIPPYYELHITLEDIFIVSHSIKVKGKKCKKWIGTHGYYSVSLQDHMTLLHSLVCEIFHGPRPDGYYVNHKDGNKLNNWPGNLEWATPAANIQHAHDTGLIKMRRGEKHPHWKGGISLDEKAYQKQYREAHKEKQKLYMKAYKERLKTARLKEEKGNE